MTKNKDVLILLLVVFLWEKTKSLKQVKSI